MVKDAQRAAAEEAAVGQPRTAAPTARQVPPTATKKRDWYAKHMGRARWKHHLVEGLLISAGVATPVAVAMTDSVVVPAVLGAIVAGLTAARLVFRFDDDWRRFAVAYMAISAEIDLFEVGAAPYDTGPEEAMVRLLVTRLNQVQTQETMKWSDLRESMRGHDA